MTQLIFLRTQVFHSQNTTKNKATLRLKDIPELLLTKDRWHVKYGNRFSLAFSLFLF